MKKYLEYKSEIEGLKDVLETVKITEKVAASNIHFLRKEMENFGLYIEALEKVINRILLFSSVENHPLLSQKTSGQKALIIVTGNKGLVGDLYHNLISSLLKKSANYQFFINIGDKGDRYLKEEGIKINKSFSDVSEIPQFKEIISLTNYVFSEFQKGGIRKIDILYPRFISLSQHDPVIVQFLPFRFNLNPQLTEESLGFPIFEPSKGKIFSELLKKYIKVFFYRIIIEAKLSEISARTIFAEHAVAKTKKTIRGLILDYLKERRKIITQKQIESFMVHQIV